MRHLGKFDLQGNNILNMALKPLDTYPLDPKPGSLEMIMRRVMICVETTDNLPVWVPLTNELNMYVHTQEVASDVWVVQHNMSFSTPLIQVFSETGEPMQVENIQPIDVDSVQITMLHASKGRAVVVSGALGGLPHEVAAFSQKVVGLNVWEIDHGLGYNPRTEVYVGGYEVQPSSLVHVSNMQLVVTFPSAVTGEIFCY